VSPAIIGHHPRSSAILQVHPERYLADCSSSSHSHRDISGHRRKEKLLMSSSINVVELSRKKIKERKKIILKTEMPQFTS
jgi:hypothetical protein